MKNRLKQIRQHGSLNLSQEAFGKRLGVTGAAISRIENGSREPSDQIILAVCREFDVNETWLRTGEGKMFNQTPQTVLGELAKEFRLSNLELRIIDNYLKLSDNDRAAVQKWLIHVINDNSSDSALTPAIFTVTSPPPEKSQLTELAGKPAPKPDDDAAIEAAARKKADAYYEQLLLEARARTSEESTPAKTG